MIFLFILLFSLIQQISSQTYEEKCFDIDSTDSKLECSAFNSFYNIYESNVTNIVTKPSRYTIIEDQLNFKKILNIILLYKYDNGNGTFYAQSNTNYLTNIYNTLIYSKIMISFNPIKLKLKMFR
jgi:hypothetical protein